MHMQEQGAAEGGRKTKKKKAIVAQKLPFVSIMTWRWINNEGDKIDKVGMRSCALELRISSNYAQVAPWLWEKWESVLDMYVEWGRLSNIKVFYAKYQCKFLGVPPLYYPLTSLLPQNRVIAVVVDTILRVVRARGFSFSCLRQWEGNRTEREGEENNFPNFQLSYKK